MAELSGTESKGSRVRLGASGPFSTFFVFFSRTGSDLAPAGVMEAKLPVPELPGLGNEREHAGRDKANPHLLLSVFICEN